MPLSLEPGTVFPIVLNSDSSKPEESRPTFYSRSLSMREQMALSKEMEDSLQGEIEQRFMETCKLLNRYVLRTENCGAFCGATEAWLDLLNYKEARELLIKIHANQFVSVDEKKS